jgi:hypothetical protein
MNTYFIRKRLFVFIVCILNIQSCIDRDSVSGTGRVEPYRLVYISGDQQIGQVRKKLQIPLSVKVVSESNNPMRNISVEFVVVKGQGTLTDTTQLTDLDGIVQSYYSIGSTPGANEIHAIVPGLKGSPMIFSIWANVGVPGISASSGMGQTGTVGQNLPEHLGVLVSDENGNAVPDTIVTFSILSGGGKISPSSCLTNQFGIASATWRMDTIAGVKYCEARLAPNKAVQFMATASAISVPFNYEIVSGQNQTGVQGRTLPENLVVCAKDKYGNKIPNFLFNFGATKGGGSVFPSTTVSDASGNAATSFTLGYDGVVQQIFVYTTDKKNVLSINASAYIPVTFDSLKSAAGKVFLYWEKNVNPNFLNYSVYRHTTDNNFPANASLLAIKTDQNIVTFEDSGVVVGTTYYYDVKVNHTNGISYFIGLASITVLP